MAIPLLNVQFLEFFTRHERIEHLEQRVRAQMLGQVKLREQPLPVLEKIADEIEQELQSALEREITTEQVGEMVMKRLKDVDEVAYVRFASVYRQFKDIDTFMQELTKLLNDRG